MRIKLQNTTHTTICFDHPVTRSRIYMAVGGVIELDEPKSTVEILKSMTKVGFSVSEYPEPKKSRAKAIPKEETVVEAPVVEESLVVEEKTKSKGKKGRQPVKL